MLVDALIVHLCLCVLLAEMATISMDQLATLALPLAKNALLLSTASMMMKKIQNKSMKLVALTLALPVFLLRLAFRVLLVLSLPQEIHVKNQQKTANKVNT